MESIPSMDEVNETLEFMRFAIRPDSTYSGIVVFVLHDQDQVEHVHSVRIRDGSVTIGSSASSASCIVRCAQDTFLGVYSGELHPRTAILGGRLHVDGFNYGELRRFLSSFDFSSAKWRDFYRVRDSSTPSASAILASWRSMLVPTAQAQSASRALHLSRRLLTQSRISEANDSTAAAAITTPPTVTTSSRPMVTLRGHTPETAARALQAMVRHPILTVAREHADFMYRLL